VALQLSALWLDPNDAKQAALFAQFLDGAPSPIPVTGCFANDEYATTALVSSYGDWMAVMTWPNAPLQGGDLTAFSGIRPELKQYDPQMDQARILSTLGKRPVAALWCSDGDNIHYQMDRGYHGAINWVWEELQGHRFGWSNNPTLIDLAPVIWNYYQNSRNEVRFVSGFSGAGFAYPHFMTDSQLDDYLKAAATYLSQTRERAIWVDIQGSRTWEKRLARRYYQRLKKAGYLGAFFDGLGPRWGLPFVYEGVPAPAAFPAYNLSSTNGQDIIDDIMARKTDETFIDLNSQYPYLNLNRGQIIKDPRAFGKEAFYLRRGNPNWELVVGGPAAVFPPGDYTVAFRLKVPQNQSAQVMAQLYVGCPDEEWPDPGWQFLARRSIAANNFKAANQYQDFMLTFKLDQLTTQIEFRIDYGGSSSDLYVDYVCCRSKESLGLPVFAPILIPLVGTPQRLTEAPHFAEDFERAGGVTLTPEEFLAALNPKYMIGLGEKLLGVKHPDLIRARTLLKKGDFLTSLLSARKAMKNLAD
jgi:hypothetical protein